MIIHQCKFRSTLDENQWHGGIYCECGNDSFIICGCSGSLFEIEDIIEYEIFDDWVNLSEEIIGD